MKCPKCGYISFDYNQVCPKCNKDISPEQGKLNIPALKPDPPSLLGALMGAPGGAEGNLNASGEISLIRQEGQISLGDSASFHAESAGLGDSQEVDLSLELDVEETAEPPLIAGVESPPGAEVGNGEQLTISLDESAVFPSPGVVKRKEPAAEEIPFELEEIAIESRKLEEGGAAGEGDDRFEIDLSDLSLEEVDAHLVAPEPVPPKRAGGGVALGIGSLALEAGKEAGAEEDGEITLSLDDLKVNETGELEIGKTIRPAKGEGEVEIMEEMTLEFEPASPQADGEMKDEEVRLLLGDDTIVIPAAEAEERQIDLDNLDIELDLDDPDRK